MDALTTISSKFQVVIPRSIREQFHLKPGQKLMFIPLDKTIKIVVVPSIEEAQGMYPGIDTNVEREEEERV